VEPCPGGYSTCTSGTACATKCNAAGAGSGCQSGYVCTGGGSNGTCSPNLNPGDPCTQDGQCKDGICTGLDAGAADGGVCN
jgi:hypothetical protein